MIPRLHLFEIEDQAWCPRPLRRAVTDMLRFFWSGLHIGKTPARKLAELMRATDCYATIDLCSGSGGPNLYMKTEVERILGRPVACTLSDLYPNLEAFRRLEQHTAGAIRYVEASVDAANVSPSHRAIRTMFASFHHFQPDLARRILEGAYRQRAPIAIFEITARTAPSLVQVAFASLLGTLVLSPLAKPWSWSRLALTYVFPLLPVALCWDGWVSSLRTYSVAELRAMTADLSDGYAWDIGRFSALGLSLPYIIGRPL